MLGQGQNLVRIARVLKANGADGEVVLGFQGIDPEDIDLKEPVFIYFDGSPIPFFMETYCEKAGGNRALVRLTGIRNEEDTREIIGQDVYAAKDSLREEDGRPDDLSRLIGWTVVQSPHRPIGRITDFVDIPGNPCVEVETKNGAAMIPLHEDLIECVDAGTRTIVMTLPDGLI